MSDPSPTQPQDASVASVAREVSVRDQRVAVIVDLKMRLRWRRGGAARLAAEWAVTEAYVHELATDANKRVRCAAHDPDSIAASLLPDLMATYQAASRSVRRRDSDSDPHAQAKMAASVASLGTLLADIAGLKAPRTTKTELTGKDGGPLQMQRTGVVILPPEDPEGSGSAPPDDDPPDPVEP